jgi:hypothetical protein
MLNRRKYLLLFAIILLGSLLISGCSTIIFGPSGSIEVISNPSGAKIFLDSKDTGKITPYTVKNVSAGNHIIEVTFSDMMKYTEIAEVKAYQTTSIYIEFYSQITLDKINVLPSYTTITLSLGSTVKINKVTAYYSDYSSASISLTNCTYSSNDAYAAVNSSGTITGISAGAAIITVSYTEAGITKTDTVLVYIRNTPTDTPITPPAQNDIVYRALLVGVGDYIGINDDLDAPPYDVDRMRHTLENCRFGSSDTKFSIINELIDLDATKTAILDRIASTFSGADDNDISYFYFSGHGYGPDVPEDTSASYICPADTVVDTSSMISINELETELSKIPGTKVVFLDSCHSGGFIGKCKGKITISKEEMVSFNDEIINVFSQAQSKGLLTTNQYKVLTACHYYQTSTELIPSDSDPYSLFTKVLCDGCGYNSYTHPYPADGNSNGKITLHEAYTYTYEQVNIEVDYLNALHPDWNIDQDTQVYPLNSNFIIIEE